MTTRPFSNQATCRRPAFIPSTIATIIQTIVLYTYCFLLFLLLFSFACKRLNQTIEKMKRSGVKQRAKGWTVMIRPTTFIYIYFFFFCNSFNSFGILMDWIGRLQLAAQFTSVTLLGSGNKWKREPLHWIDPAVTNRPTDPIFFEIHIHLIWIVRIDFTFTTQF